MAILFQSRRVNEALLFRVATRTGSESRYQRDVAFLPEQFWRLHFKRLRLQVPAVYHAVAFGLGASDQVNFLFEDSAAKVENIIA